MAGALTHPSHKKSRSNSSFSGRALNLRRRYYFSLFAFIIFVFYYTRTPTPTSTSTASVQQKAYNLAPKRRPTCQWSTWNSLRYAPLLHPSRRVTTFLAMNLYQNEEVLPNFFQELPIILNQLGPQNVFVSIYENNSEDKTQELLKLCTWCYRNNPVS